MDYTLKSSNPSIYVSEIYPYDVRMMCEESGQFYQVYLYQPDFVPDIDWLLSFGIEPYRPADISLPVVGDEAAAATERPDFLQESKNTDS